MTDVNKKQLVQYIAIEKEIQKLESKGALKSFEEKKKRVDDVTQTVRSVEIHLNDCVAATKKEKQDVTNMLKSSVKEMFQSQSDFDAKMTKEQEEYMEALNEEEVVRKQMEGLTQQKNEYEKEANKVKVPADKLKAFYEERDNLLCEIFNGEYGSVEENRLEAEYDLLMDQKQRVSVANFKWNNARVLLQHAVQQLSYAVARWKEAGSIAQTDTQRKYLATTEVRNNIIAAIQNLRSTQMYLSTIEFPYCKPGEVTTLEKACNNIYTDAQSGQERFMMAMQCYDVTMQRAAALLQWFDMVIVGTIQKDLLETATKVRGVEQNLRAERIKLIRVKVEESGGNTKDLNETGLKGETVGYFAADFNEDEDLGLEKLLVARPDGMGLSNDIPGGAKMPQAPIPLAELAPMPSEKELFGNIDELKKQYEHNTQEFMKTQEMNKARMEQGLQEKLTARRHKKTKG